MYALWTQVELRVLAKEFPDPSQDSLGFAKDFELTIRTYEPGFPDLYQLIQLLVSESQARKWIEKAGWKSPLMDFESHSPEACTEYKELAQKIPEFIPELFPKTVDWTEIQQCKQRSDESILNY